MFQLETVQLDGAQRPAPDFGQLDLAIAHAVRQGIEDGRYVVVDGVVKLADSPTIEPPPDERRVDALSPPAR
jgi:hypothetical protein